ncbi:MAG: hypothetical protein H6Q70_1152 [Firmicutes bacterium]|nr:hypothetical protein [Bacillota bacterium]
MNYKKAIAEIIDKEMENQNGYAKEWIKEITKNKYICIFGGGQHGFNWFNYLKELNIKVDFICDNDESKWNRRLFEDVKCISPSELKNYKDNVSIIIAIRNFDPICKQLMQVGLNLFYVAPIDLFYFKSNMAYAGNKKELMLLKEKISRVIELCADKRSKKICFETVKRWFDNHCEEVSYFDKQYFVDDIIQLNEDESFVDVGAFDGDTIETFLQESKYTFSDIYAFEMDQNIYKILSDKVNNIDQKIKEKIHLYQMGIWNCESTFQYSKNLSSSKIDESGENSIKVDTLDHILQDKKVTFLKMDIEGAEMKALEGTKKIIIQNKPKLAICIYHLPEHLWEIPLYLKKIVPEYKIYIRHHSKDSSETVCYAVIK